MDSAIYLLGNYLSTWLQEMDSAKQEDPATTRRMCLRIGWNGELCYLEYSVDIWVD